MEPGEAYADDDFARAIDRILGRVGQTVEEVQLVTGGGSISAEVRAGDREGYFIAPLPDAPVEEVVVLGADRTVVRR
ncbi:MAG: hypothetical protein AB1679_02715 [Actinomycetota bacterium]